MTFTMRLTRAKDLNALVKTVAVAGLSGVVIRSIVLHHTRLRLFRFVVLLSLGSQSG